MITSLLNDILLLKNSPLEKTVDYLRTSGITIFNTIIDSTKYNEKEKHQIILYIFCAYSEESPLIVLRQDSKDEKEQICEYLDIPEINRHNITSFHDQDIRKATTTYLWQFAGELFRNLMFMKIQYDDFDRDITNREFTTKEFDEKDDSGNSASFTVHYDIKEHNKAIAERDKLAKAIFKLETDIKKQIKVYEGIEEMRAWKDKVKGKWNPSSRGMQMENSTLIR